jgi:hypothetical protein
VPIAEKRDLVGGVALNGGPSQLVLVLEKWHATDHTAESAPLADGPLYVGRDAALRLFTRIVTTSIA